MRTSSMRIDQQAMTCECGSPAQYAKVIQVVDLVNKLAIEGVGLVTARIGT